jgi:hypothetical protein
MFEAHSTHLTFFMLLRYPLSSALSLSVTLQSSLMHYHFAFTINITMPGRRTPALRRSARINGRPQKPTPSKAPAKRKPGRPSRVVEDSDDDEEEVK